MRDLVDAGLGHLNDAVERGWLRLPVLRTLSLLWFAAALVPGVYLYGVVGVPAIWLGLIGIAAAAWYACGRPSMAQLGLAEIVFFVMFGVIAVAATYYVQAVARHAVETLRIRAFVVGLPSAALVTNVLLIDDIRDVEFDRSKGWRTTAVRFGVVGSRREHLALTVVAYVGVVVLAIGYGAWLLLPLLTLPLGLAAERTVWTAPHREVLIPWTPRSAFLAMAHATLVALGLALS